MQFFKSDDKKETILFVNKKNIDDKTAREILKFTSSKKRVGLDMSKVETIQSENFISYLNENKFKLFNLKSELLAYLSLIFNGGFLKTYVLKEDFSQNKRELIMRHFFVD